MSNSSFKLPRCLVALHSLDWIKIGSYLLIYYLELSPNWLLQAFQQEKYNASVICITREEWDWKLLANIDTFFFYLIKTSNNSLIKISQYRLLFILVIEPLFGDSQVQLHQTWWAEIVYLLHLKQTVKAPHVRRPPECKRLNLRPFIHNFHCKENQLINLIMSFILSLFYIIHVYYLHSLS